MITITITMIATSLLTALLSSSLACGPFRALNMHGFNGHPRAANDALHAEIEVAVANQREAEAKNEIAESQILGDQGQPGG